MMRLLPREVDRLLLRQAAELARSRQARGLYSASPRHARLLRIPSAKVRAEEVRLPRWSRSRPGC